MFQLSVKWSPTASRVFLHKCTCVHWYSSSCDNPFKELCMFMYVSVLMNAQNASSGSLYPSFRLCSVTSSEKADKAQRYADFTLLSVPYPGKPIESGLSVTHWGLHWHAARADAVFLIADITQSRHATIKIKTPPYWQEKRAVQKLPSPPLPPANMPVLRDARILGYKQRGERFTGFPETLKEDRLISVIKRSRSEQKIIERWEPTGNGFYLCNNHFRSGTESNASRGSRLWPHFF